MEDLVKILRKASRKDRERLLATMDALRRGDLDGMQIKKLTNSPFFRVRVGDFRIIFSMDSTRRVTIESVRRRNESTY